MRTLVEAMEHASKRCTLRRQNNIQNIRENKSNE